MRRHGWFALACVLAGATMAPAQPALPEGAVARLGMPRLRVPEAIYDTGFSPDGRTFVMISGSKEGRWNVVLFDVATGLERKRIDLRNYQDVAIARHKPLMVVITTKGFEVCDLATEKVVAQWPHPGPEWRTSGLAISPDGAEVVAAFSQRDKAVILRWDATTGKALPARYPTGSEIRAVSFSADGSKLLTASEDRVVPVKDSYTTIPGTIIAWDRKSGMKLAELATVYPKIEFSPDGNRFVRGTTGKNVEIMDIATGKCLAEFAEPHGQFAFTPDSKRVVIVSSGPVRLWDIEANKELRPFEGTSQARSVRPCFSADGRRLAIVHYDAGANHVQFWDVATGKRLRFDTGHPGAVEGLAYSPDGRRLATFSKDTLLLFDIKTGNALHRWVGHEEPISQIAFSPDGKLLASASWGGTIALWETPSAKLRHRLSAKAYGRVLAFTRDGATLIAAGSNRSLQSWDVETGVRQRTYEVGRMFAPAISPTGQLLAWFTDVGEYGQPGKTLQFMNARTGQRMPAITPPREKPKEDGEFGGGHTLPALSFSTDGKLLATCDSFAMHKHLIRVWETSTRREILRFAAMQNSTRLLAISPDGRTLAHGFHPAFTWGGHGDDATLLLRDIASGQSDSLKSKEKYRPLAGHHGSITSLAFSPDSKFIATGGSDQVVYLWRVEDFCKRLVVPEYKGDVAALWPPLADANAGKAYQAIAQHESKPKETVALLRQHLRPVPTADEKVIAMHLRDLSSANFAARQQAYSALEKSGDQAAHFLLAALKRSSNLEMKRRIETLIENFDRPLEEPGQIRLHRCLVLLERIGTPEARKLLQELSQGAPAAWLTIEARHSLKRLTDQ